jgi:hypothetical protein
LALAAVLFGGCRFETRPPAGTGQTRATVQAAVAEHYRARTVLAADSVEYSVVRRQADVRRDLASVWVTLHESHHLRGGVTRDTTTLEHLLLRRTDEGWIVLAATRVNAP